MSDYWVHDNFHAKLTDGQCPFCKIRELEATCDRLMTARSRDQEAAIKAERAADAHIKRLEDRINQQQEERVHELSKEITNYLNNGDIKLRKRILELEQELDDARIFYADLLINSGKEIRRLEGLLNAMCGPGTAETSRRD